MREGRGGYVVAGWDGGGGEQGEMRGPEEPGNKKKQNDCRNCASQAEMSGALTACIGLHIGLTSTNRQPQRCPTGPTEGRSEEERKQCTAGERTAKTPACCPSRLVLSFVRPFACLLPAFCLPFVCLLSASCLSCRRAFCSECVAVRHFPTFSLATHSPDGAQCTELTCPASARPIGSAAVECEFGRRILSGGTIALERVCNMVVHTANWARQCGRR